MNPRHMYAFIFFVYSALKARKWHISPRPPLTQPAYFSALSAFSLYFVAPFPQPLLRRARCGRGSFA